MGKYLREEFNWYSHESEEVKRLKRDSDTLRVTSLVTGGLSAVFFGAIDYNIFSGSLTDIANQYKAEGFANDCTGFGIAVISAGLSLSCYYLSRRREKSAHIRSALEQKLFEDEQDEL